MIEIMAVAVCGLSLLAACVLLIILTIIDCRVRLLPNKYVFPFGALGLVFHASLDFSILSTESLLMGACVGYALLYAIRHFGNMYYQQESLGLGDVKLMAAAGLWLGVENLMLALTIGASLSLLHGIVYAVVKKVSLRRLEIPAGPGLIGGIIVMIAWMIWENIAIIKGSFF